MSHLSWQRGFGEPEAVWVESGPHRIVKVYKKALYQEYTDESFTTLKPRPPEWEHLGILGPLLRAEVGDTIRIVYRNNVQFPTGLHPLILAHRANAHRRIKGIFHVAGRQEPLVTNR